MVKNIHSAAKYTRNWGKQNNEKHERVQKTTDRVRNRDFPVYPTDNILLCCPKPDSDYISKQIELLSTARTSCLGHKV
jgi:hypothetical protein